MTDPLIDLDPANNFVPERVRSIHIMGICGTAMAAMAGMLKQDGYTISGSDSQVYPPMSDLLKQMNITVFSGYEPANLAHRPDLVIVGNVITRKNPEAQALAVMQLPYLSMPQALSQFYISGHRSLVLTGTHGKTTTSSMLASALYHCEADPGFMIGGVVREFKSNYRIGGGPYFVVEGDEYDTAFFDKESKFFHYQPEIAVITSIEFDHADIFSDLDSIKRSFRKFVSLMPAQGLLIANLDDEHVANVVAQAPCPVLSYGFGTGRDWRIGDISSAPGTTIFELSHAGEPYGHISIQLPGAHNCLNAAAVAAIMNHLGFSLAEIQNGLRHFSGVKRRQEIRGIVNDIIVMDDFAHHPTAVLETLNALRQAYAGNRLVAVFEPRSNTSRRSCFQDTYAVAFDSADIVMIREPIQRNPHEDADRFSAVQLAADLQTKGIDASSYENTERILEKLTTIARPGDVIAILSNGGFDDIHRRLLDRLSETAIRHHASGISPERPAAIDKKGIR